MNPYWSPVVGGLSPYVPGEQPKISGLIKLNTNENPYGPSAGVLKALADEAAETLRLYPDPNSDRLREAVAGYYHLKPGQVFVGNGSDEVLAHAFLALLNHEEPLLFPDITYSFYPVYCGLYQIHFQTIPLTRDFRIDLDDYCRPNGGVIFANPNAPTGCALPLAEIERFLENNTESVVVIDEAYVDFGAETAIGLIDRFPNLLVIQTLSKSRSLAGLRVGLAMGNEELIEALDRVKNSFNSYPLDRFAISGAVAAFQDDDHFRKTRQKIIETRERLVAALQGLGFAVLPSQCNFIFARYPGKDAAELALTLRNNAILVRHFRQERIDQFLRITIGTDTECARLVEVLTEILGRR
jgi:histidinol-phosphate aminotransferase